MTDLDSIMSHEQRHIERNLYRSRLIELVRSNPILWDKKSPDFNQRLMKIRKWLEVSEQLGVSTDKLRRTWENLRDQYRRDLKRTLSKNIRSKWRFFNDMNFIRSNVRIKGSSFDDCGNSDTESDYEDKACDKYVSCLLSSSSSINQTQSNLAATTTAVVALPNFLPIQLNTEWKQQQVQQLEKSAKEQNQHSTNLQSFYRLVAQQQSCDSSEEQKFGSDHDDYHVVDNGNTSPDVVKIEIDSDSNDTTSNQDVVTPARPSTTVQQRQEPLAVPQSSGCITTAAITPTPSQHVSEACVTTSGNSTGAKRRHRHSTMDDALAEDEYKHSFRNQRQHDASQDATELQDEDYHFVMSILPALRQVTRHRKFPLRSQIMTLISKELEESHH